MLYKNGDRISLFVSVDTRDALLSNHRNTIASTCKGHSSCFLVEKLTQTLKVFEYPLFELLLTTPPLIGERSIMIRCLSVCLSVCLRLFFFYPQSYLQNCTSDLYQFFVHYVTYGRGSVVLSYVVTDHLSSTDSI